MKRDVIVSKLIAEGFSEKTLVKFTDKQLSDLAERMLSEQPTTQSNQMQVTANVNDPNFSQVMTKLKQSGISAVSVTEEDDVNEEKPSAGLTKEKKSEVVKKAKKGGDIGKKGKGFEKISNKAAKKYGSKESGQKVAAAAMWKNLKEGPSEIKNWVDMLAEENFHSFTSKNEIMELIQLKLNESEVAHEPKVPEFMTYDSIKSSGPAVAPTKPKISPGTKPGTSPGKPKPRTPYEPGIGPKHKPKAYGLKEDDMTELDQSKTDTKPE